MRNRKTPLLVGIGCLVLAAAPVLLVGWWIFGFLVLGPLHIRSNEAYLSRPEVYTPVARTLVLYCQSDPALFPRTLDAAWFPDVLDRFPHCRGEVSRDGASIEFGGGFYHYGYSLARDAQRSRPGVNVWNLFRNAEGSDDRPLLTLETAAREGLTAEALAQRVARGYDRQIAVAGADEDAREHLHRAKIQMLLRFHQVSDARRACGEMLAALPDNWWARLTTALIAAEERSPAEAERSYRAWVQNRPDFFRHLDLACFHQLRGEPRKAAAAATAAAKYDANVAWGHGGNAEYRGYTVAMDAFRSGEFAAARDLCDTLLPVTINGDFAKPALRALRDAAERGMKGEEPAAPAWSEEIPRFDPFEGIDIDRLLGRRLPGRSRRPDTMATQ